MLEVRWLRCAALVDPGPYDSKQRAGAIKNTKNSDGENEKKKARNTKINLGVSGIGIKFSPKMVSIAGATTTTGRSGREGPTTR